MEASYEAIPILHAFEAVLRDAFNESGAAQFENWSDGKTLKELVGQRLATEFYERWYWTEGIPVDWSNDVPFYLGGQINNDWESPGVLVTERGRYDILFAKAPMPNKGVYIKRV